MDQYQAQNQQPPAGYPTENPPVTEKKKHKFMSKSKPKGDRGFIEGW
ncbi:OLC1v1036582C3 [Oldenlandia corymbosa var. corymbosa]|uniref:OLC1v1036582C3 n=1 Tax=Oldenlandia corymbosa var. corymbosa TaxID=529605 RepID=A0AAV1CWK4_OLDCO|nr:OLC1v1036582C3 [Oldenlandia corymbosa var. corymbosa]